MDLTINKNKKEVAKKSNLFFLKQVYNLFI